MASDAELLAAWQDGDERSGEELFRRRVGEITRFFRNKAPEPDVADLVGQTFLGIVSSVDRFRGDTSFRRYAYAVANNVLREFIRRRYKREREQVDFSALCVAQLSAHSPSSIVMKKREVQTFVDALRTVPIDDQVLLELRFFEGLTGPEIAETLAVTEGSIRGKLARATERLRKLVETNVAKTTAGTAPNVTAEDLETWAAEVRQKLGREAGP